MNQQPSNGPKPARKHSLKRPAILVIPAIATIGFGFAVERAMRPEVTDPVVCEEDFASTPLPVDVVHAVRGGLPREIIQTGNIESWESVDLHARVGGY